MSSPGYFMPGQDPEQQKRNAMAAALMGGGGSGAVPQGNYGGLADAGQSLARAVMYNSMKNGADPENQTLQQRYGMTANQAGGVMGQPSIWGKLGGLFNFGSGS